MTMVCRNVSDYLHKFPVLSGTALLQMSNYTCKPRFLLIHVSAHRRWLPMLVIIGPIRGWGGRSGIH